MALLKVLSWISGKIKKKFCPIINISSNILVEALVKFYRLALSGKAEKKLFINLGFSGAYGRRFVTILSPFILDLPITQAIVTIYSVLPPKEKNFMTKKNKMKELSLCHKLKISKPYIFAI